MHTLTPTQCHCLLLITCTFNHSLRSIKSSSQSKDDQAKVEIKCIAKYTERNGSIRYLYHVSLLLCCLCIKSCHIPRPIPNTAHTFQYEALKAWNGPGSRRGEGGAAHNVLILIGLTVAMQHTPPPPRLDTPSSCS